MPGNVRTLPRASVSNQIPLKVKSTVLNNYQISKITFKDIRQSSVRGDLSEQVQSDEDDRQTARPIGNISMTGKKPMVDESTERDKA